MSDTSSFDRMCGEVDAAVRLLVEGPIDPQAGRNDSLLGELEVALHVLADAVEDGGDQLTAEMLHVIADSELVPIKCKDHDVWTWHGDDRVNSPLCGLGIWKHLADDVPHDPKRILWYTLYRPTPSAVYLNLAHCLVHVGREHVRSLLAKPNEGQS